MATDEIRALRPILRLLSIMEAASLRRDAAGKALSQIRPRRPGAARVAAPRERTIAERLLRIAEGAREIRFATAARLAVLLRPVPKLTVRSLDPRDQPALLDPRRFFGIPYAAMDAMLRYIDAARTARQAGFEVTAVRALSAAAKDLRDSGVPDDTPLIGAGETLEAGSDTEQEAHAEVPIPAPFCAVSWIVHPDFWVPCIGQMESVEYLAPLPDGLSFEVPLRETVNLTTPIPVGTARLVTELDVKVNIVPEVSAEVTYTMRPGGSTVLDADEGSILVRPITDEVTLVSIDKRIVLKPPNTLGWLFDLDPDGLQSLLTYWIVQATKLCTGSRPVDC